MNYLDFIIIIILFISAISGYHKGFIHQLASLTALILGIYFAFKFSGMIAPWIEKHWIIGANLAYIIAFVSVFILVLIAIHKAGRIIEKILENIEMGILNKLLGSIFAISKMILILSAIFLILNFCSTKLAWPNKQDMEKSFLYKPVMSVTPTIFPFIKETSKCLRTNKMNPAF
jgi:membrane protein required for colicin V production